MKISIEKKVKKFYKKSEILNKQSIQDFYRTENKNKISVIIPSYNAEKDIERCVDSILNQTYPIDNIEIIIVDDGSTDGTNTILENYASKYSNVIISFLHKNTGTPSVPRNIGINIASGEFIMFLDSDDWLNENAITSLHEIITKNHDDFVVGRTIKMTDNSSSVHAEFISYKKRLQKKPLEIPYLLYHMGPPSKLMKTKIIKDNNILFPELKFAEDKSFFIHVLSHCKKVSTITQPICYISRYSSNNSSLTRVVSLFEKRTSDLVVLQDILNSNFDLDYEKEAVKRIVEYDLVRSCNSNLFLKSKDPFKFFDLIKKALNMLRSRPYNVIKLFDSSFYSIVAELIENNQKEDALKLITWNKTETNKILSIIDSYPYYNISDLDIKNFNYVELPIQTFTKSVYMNKEIYKECIEVLGEKTKTAHELVIRDKKGNSKDIILPLNIENNNSIIQFSIDKIKHLKPSLYGIYIRYDGYKLLTIKRELKDCSFGQFKFHSNDKEYIFYTTMHGNLGLSIKLKNKK